MKGEKKNGNETLQRIHTIKKKHDSFRLCRNNKENTRKIFTCKKERRLAIKSLLSSKVLEKELTVVDKLELAEIKTKTMVKALADLKVEGKTLIVLPENNKNVLMSARNIEGVKTITLNNINVFDLLKYNNLVLPLETVKKIEEVYA